MTDDREDTEDEAGAGDPAAAFEALRRTVEGQGVALAAEMAIIRRGVEAAFDQFDKLSSPPDYGADLGRILQQLGQATERLAGVEQSPVLRQGAEHYARALERSGEGLVRSAAQQLERQAADLERTGRQLAGYIDSARAFDRQNLWLVGVGVAGVMLGVALTLFVPRILPFSAAPHIASIVMADTPWQSGMSLMRFASPEGWDRLREADQLVEANKGEVAACRETAAKAGREQKCTITVAVPVK
ncbi:DUF6118 family protein [Pleomorphomonas carboxyditropha]|uniref:Uncharacterized protein n=1 Tax=Pleomorphomonas carboxyditropha TaxID=2023338 RepID=A0A2G9WPZ3_9HYPH|nr:DUF6118 family protein [Pleomorphomonas carboxyditropha]PIO96372.1 hypothetical protein CJ014_25630 [Pleomorphomonas carboxyditropha]